MAVSRELFRNVMGYFATGVTVVTARQSSGKPCGFTVNSFASVSLSPPLVLFCVDHESESYPAMMEAEHFAVNFLAEDQGEVSRRFASKNTARFDNLNYRDGAYGSPRIEGCTAFVECRKIAAHPHGDHAVIIGDVLEAEAMGGNPLLFYRGCYGRLAASLEPSKR